MPMEHSAYYMHHPLTKQAAAAPPKPVFTTIKNTVKDFFTPKTMAATAVGAAGGAYLGNKSYKAKSAPPESVESAVYTQPNIPPVKVLPDLDDRALIQPINQQVQ